jgi:S1-C subfamily serine protease
MKQGWIALVLTAALVAPMGASAQERSRPRAREEGPFRLFSFGGQRGRIGVVVNTAADTEKDKVGARVEAVTPNGPAAKAGLRADDIITKFGTTSLAGLSSQDREESGPGMKLLELARELDPGDTVQVEYRRGTETRRGTIIAEDLRGDGQMRGPEGMWGQLPQRAPGWGNDPRVEVFGPDMPPGFSFSFGMPWAGLNLVTLDADLGDYFGTREGVLVVKAPADSALPLKSGDVILAIDGRKPSSPEHAMRILRSYQAGEAVKLDIMRQKRRSTVTWTVPDEDQMYRVRPREQRLRQEQF